MFVFKSLRHKGKTCMNSLLPVRAVRAEERLSQNAAGRVGRSLKHTARMFLPPTTHPGAVCPSWGTTRSGGTPYYYKGQMGRCQAARKPIEILWQFSARQRAGDSGCAISMENRACPFGDLKLQYIDDIMLPPLKQEIASSCCSCRRFDLVRAQS